MMSSSMCLAVGDFGMGKDSIIDRLHTANAAWMCYCCILHACLALLLLTFLVWPTG